MTARREAAKVEFYDLFELGRSSKRIIKIRFFAFLFAKHEIHIQFAYPAIWSYMKF